MRNDRTPRASEIADLQYYKDVAAGRRQPDEMAFFRADPSQPAPVTRAEIYESGVQQGFFCQTIAFGMIPSPTAGMPEHMMLIFLEGVLAGAEEARRQEEIEEALAEQAKNVIPFRRR